MFRPAIFSKSEIWTPARNLSVISEWWCADDLPAGAVSAWKGRRNAASITLSQGTGGAQPVCTENSINGKKAVVGDGVDDCLELAATTNLPTGNATGRIFALCSGVAGSAIQCLVGYGNAAASCRRVNLTAAERPQVTDGTTNLDQGTDSSGLGVCVIEGLWTGTSMFGVLNGTSFPGSPATIASLATATSRTRFLANSASTAGQFSASPLRQVIITPLGAETVPGIFDRIRAYLLWDAGRPDLLPSTSAWLKEPPRV